MFDRLWRHDLARSDSSHSGLGLSIAKTSAEVLSLTLRADLEDKSIRFTLKSNEEDERS
jgi:signal transduction histidine kinase